MKRVRVSLLLLALFLASLTAALAQVPSTVDPPQPLSPAASEGESGELRDAMRRYFYNRLRQELSLSDEQMENLIPRLEELQAIRMAATRQRAETMRQLHQGMGGGASDSELQALLSRLEQVEVDLRLREQEIMGEIDGWIAVRQRVQLRFFVERFRQEMQRRVRDLRGDPSDRPGFDPGRGPLGGERR